MFFDTGPLRHPIKCSINYTVIMLQTILSTTFTGQNYTKFTYSRQELVVALYFASEIKWCLKSQFGIRIVAIMFWLSVLCMAHLNLSEVSKH